MYQNLPTVFSDMANTTVITKHTVTDRDKRDQLLTSSSPIEGERSAHSPIVSPDIGISRSPINAANVQTIIAGDAPTAHQQSRSRRIKHLCIVVACVLLVLPLYWAMSAIAPAKSGLDCDNLSFYRHPHKQPFMSTLLFTILCYAVAFVILLLTELLMLCMYHDASHHALTYSLCPSWNVPPWLYFTLRNYVVYIFGVQGTQGGLYLIRKMIAIPRPDFWDVCDPVFHTAYGICPPHEYTYDYTCRNPDESKWQNASRSFPSGHVAYAFFTAVFCMIFLERRCNVPKHQHDSVRYVLMTIEFWLFAACFASSAERVYYNSHHASDIYAGALFGIVGAIFVAKLLTLPSEVYWNAPCWLRPQKHDQRSGLQKLSYDIEAPRK